LKINYNETIYSKLFEFAKGFQQVCILNSNGYKSAYSKYEAVFAYSNKDSNPISTFEDYKKICLQSDSWIFSALSYDVKNDFEKLKSENEDLIQFPKIDCFFPEILIVVNDNFAEIIYPKEEKDQQKLIDQLENISLIKNGENDFSTINLKAKIEKEEYISMVNEIKKHIQAGDIYEMNYCQEFYSNSILLNPYSLYQKLNTIAPAPFSCFYKTQYHYILSSSPERYLQKTGAKIISQPIKGTITRLVNEIEDLNQKNILLNDPKEKSENVMIVDMVRNDLSRTAKRGSVQVDELFGIYAFKHVYQMISTISSELDDDFNLMDVIQTTFPMGSMTGAPKIRAMQLIEKFEKSKRGIYSGTIGYIDEKKNADFNVIIRSILYNQKTKTLSFQVGGAITASCQAEKEYSECLLKAKGILKALGLN